MFIELDIILLAVNETNSLEKTVLILKKNNEIKNIFIISPDFVSKECLDIQKKLRKENKKIKSYIQSKKYPGIGGAIIFGSKKIKSKYFAIVDGDGETDQRIIKKMINIIKKDPTIDIISASRFLKKKIIIKNYGILNSYFTFFFQKICQFLFSKKITDYTVNFRLYKTQLFKNNKFYFYDQSFALESLLVFVNFSLNIKELFFYWKKRKEGTTKNSFLNKLTYFKPLLFYYFKKYRIFNF